MERAKHQEQPASGLQGLAERLQEAVRRHPRKMTLQLAREYGVPEVEVIRVSCRYSGTVRRARRAVSARLPTSPAYSGVADRSAPTWAVAYHERHRSVTDVMKRPPPDGLTMPVTVTEYAIQCEACHPRLAPETPFE